MDIATEPYSKAEPSQHGRDIPTMLWNIRQLTLARICLRLSSSKHFACINKQYLGTCQKCKFFGLPYAKAIFVLVYIPIFGIKKCYHELYMSVLHMMCLNGYMYHSLHLCGGQATTSWILFYSFTLCGFHRLNSGPKTCTASTLHTEWCSQPQNMH